MPESKSTPLRVRRARGADAATLTEIAHAAKRHWGYPEKLIRMWQADLTVSAELAERGSVYCAARGAEIVGFYALSGRRGSRELEHMWVRPDRIGTGVGRRLFAHLRRALRAAGVKQLRIASDPHAEGFYLEMGARRVGDVPSRPRGRHLPLLILDL